MPVRLGRGPDSLLLDKYLKKTIYHQKALPYKVSTLGHNNLSQANI